MCETEFLLVKQAAAERLGVSPDRLRIKFICKRNDWDIEEKYQLFFLTGLIYEQPLSEMSDIFLDGKKYATFDWIQNGIFFETIMSADILIYSGYSFEVV